MVARPACPKGGGPQAPVRCVAETQLSPREHLWMEAGAWLLWLRPQLYHPVYPCAPLGTGSCSFLSYPQWQGHPAVPTTVQDPEWTSAHGRP